MASASRLGGSPTRLVPNADLPAPPVTWANPMVLVVMVTWRRLFLARFRQQSRAVSLSTGCSSNRRQRTYPSRSFSSLPVSLPKWSHVCHQALSLLHPARVTGDRQQPARSCNPRRLSNFTGSHPDHPKTPHRVFL